MTSTTATGPTLEVRALSKRYGARAAVDALSFSCSPGTVTGFLGPNGAGKSTTLRILTGLAEADDGMALIGGRRYRALEHPARTVGVMLDARALHGGRTGIETLRLTARTLGMPRDRAEEVLETVGLEQAATKRVGGYSYGMRQRLGIGVALMGDPSVLVLDEPANGLDPEGIRWMRRLLRSFADAGGTVLLSSHQLREVEATVDRLVVISEGRLVREGPLEELTAVTGTRVAALDQAALRRALDAHGIAFELRAGGELAVSLAPEDMGRLALREQLVLTSLGAGAGTGLEEVFFALTGHEESSADEPAPAL
ncbi:MULTISPECIES: ABC transporter ATP-binding protein [Brachybacterium]|uniref:ABC transporter ATP-binding protein n=1 Tax=Brachybacterium TaxID=43668 RepID=UPI0006B4B995|nr:MULTISPECIES: ATP-binding cassette domain-containing protein [Brachybacterium]MCZ4325226.1 ATP-binding cassette domain-containing protein [Brachybacterium paraconglomeratum]GAP78555.1 ABC transporter ATP-binding protein [Brachybacterium sp. SW0106-09]